MIGAPVAAPLLSRITVAATTVAAVGLVDLEGHLHRRGVDPGLVGGGVPPVEPARGRGGAVEAEGVLGDEPAEPGGQAEPGRRRPTGRLASRRRSVTVAMPWVV